MYVVQPSPYCGDVNHSVVEHQVDEGLLVYAGDTDEVTAHPSTGGFSSLPCAVGIYQLEAVLLVRTEAGGAYTGGRHRWRGNRRF